MKNENNFAIKLQIIFDKFAKCLNIREKKSKKKLVLWFWMAVSL
jgi:hypothetical protein